MPRSRVRFFLWCALCVLGGMGCGSGSGEDAGVDGSVPVADTGPPRDASLADAETPADGGSLLDAGPSADASPSVDAGPSGSLDPSIAGGRALSTETATVARGGRSTPVTAYVPDGASSPLVVFAPGFMLQSSRYEATLRHLASHGFIVVRADPSGSAFSPDHVAMRDDLVAVIDWAIESLAPAPGVLVVGHSLGGKLATMVAGADARVTALVGIDPVNGGSPIFGYSDTLPDVVPAVTTTLRIPAGYLGETTNGSGGLGGMACAPTAQNYQTFYDGTDGAPFVYEYTFVGADHMDFLDDTAGCGFTCSACTDGSADADAVSGSTRTLLSAFALRHLRGETALDVWLTGAMALPSVTVRSR